MASPAGFEGEGATPQPVGTIENAQNAGGGDLPSSPIVAARGQSVGSPEPADAVEAALADALEKASAAGQWDVVATLARELQVRRQSRAHVVQFDQERARRNRA